MNRRIWIVVFFGMMWTSTSEARNFAITGQNELSGGLGFAANMTEWTPGGFKWFNDYSRQLSQLTWFNFQLNVTAGDTGNRHCSYDNRGNLHCDNWGYFGGNALELAAGVKLKWRVRSIPLQIHAKLGGAFDVLFWGDTKGVGLGFRGGAGVRYFFLPTFGVGAELVNTLGPAFIGNNVGTKFMAAIDFNSGVEWHF